MLLLTASVLSSCSVTLTPLPSSNTLRIAGADLPLVTTYEIELSIEYYQRGETIEVFANDSLSYAQVRIWSNVPSECKDTVLQLTKQHETELKRFKTMILNDRITSNMPLEAGRSARYRYQQGSSEQHRSSKNLFSLTKALGLPYRKLSSTRTKA